MMKAVWDLSGGYVEFEFYLHMQISIDVPSKYTISLRVERDQPAVRLCVRGVHTNPGESQMRSTTHLHDVRRQDRAGLSMEPPVPPFGIAVEADRVTGGEYRENFSAFGRYLRLDVRSFTWEHPHIDGVPLTPVSED